MARIVRTNRLTASVKPEKVSVSDVYSIFLRGKKTDCAKKTYDIYEEIGNRYIIPRLTELTGDDMNSITVDTIRDIIAEYGMDHKATGTDFLFRHMRAFVNWYWTEYEIDKPNPIKKIKWRNHDAPPKEGITQEEVDKLLNAAKHHSVFPERDIAMLMILCDTGIRRSSLEHLRMCDVDIKRCEMMVFEKDQRYHTKAFGVATGKAIQKYLSCLADVKPEDPFWLTLDGRQLTEAGLREILRRLCSSAKIPVHHFHDFRRYYGKALYDSTHDIYLVSRALDHKDITVTKRYIYLDEIEDKENARLYSPMDRKFGQTGAKVNRNRAYLWYNKNSEITPMSECP